MSRAARDAARLIMAAAAAYVLTDALGFHLGAGDDRWYPPDWWRAPYTHARLAMYPASEAPSRHDDGSGRLIVRETRTPQGVFWTVLERVPAGASGAKEG